MTMQMMKKGSGNAQGGFTLIELVVVIVILGILAATALPRFTDLSKDARLAKIQGARAAMQTGSSVAHATWLVRGTAAAGNVDLEGKAVAVNAAGFPTNAGILVAAGGLTDYDISTAGSVGADATHADCKVTYTEADGTVGPAPTLDNCK